MNPTRPAQRLQGFATRAWETGDSDMWRLGTLFFALVLTLPLSVRGEEVRRLTHYVHQRWIEGSEAPVPVLSMAQGHDGYLWLATGDGLFRFDGISFERIVPDGSAAEDDYPTVVFVARNRDVW